MEIEMKGQFYKDKRRRMLRHPILYLMAKRWRKKQDALTHFTESYSE